MPAEQRVTVDRWSARCCTCDTTFAYQSGVKPEDLVREHRLLCAATDVRYTLVQTVSWFQQLLPLGA